MYKKHCTLCILYIHVGINVCACVCAHLPLAEIHTEITQKGF